MATESKPVKVVCPMCSKETRIDIPVFIVEGSQDGVVSVQVPAGACCPEHSFMAFIDKKFKVRGYQNADVEFSVRKEKTAEQQKAEGLRDFTFEDLVDFIGPDIVAMILRGIIAGVPISLVDTFDLYERVDKTLVLFIDLVSNELPITAEKVSKDAVKQVPHDSILIVPIYKAITQHPFKGKINTRFESILLQETLELPDRASQIVFLRKELVKIRTVINNFMPVLASAEKMYEEDIPAYLQNRYDYKFDVKNIELFRSIILLWKGKKVAEKMVSKYADFLV